MRSWLRSWIRREAASRALRVPARERMRRRSCLRIKSRARVEQRVAGRRPTNRPGGASEVQAYLELRVYRLSSYVSACDACVTIYMSESYEQSGMLRQVAQQQWQQHGRA